MNRDLERALREAEVPDAVAARERARQTVLAAHRPVRRRPRLALVWVAVACAAGGGRVLRAGHRARAGDRAARAQRVHGADARSDPGAHHAPRAAARPRRGSAVRRSAAASARSSAPWTRRDVVAARAVRRRGARATRSPRSSPTTGRCAGAAPPGAGAVPALGARRAAHRVPLRREPADRLRQRHARRARGPRHGARSPPAWRPNEPRTVAWAAKDGTVTVEDADTAKVLWSRTGGAGPSPRVVGRRPAAARRRRAQRRRSTTSSGGEPRATRRAGEIVAVAFGRARLALAVLRRAAAPPSPSTGGPCSPRPGRLRDLEWSPDGRRLLAGWPGADHWLVVRGDEVSAVRHRFAAGRPHARVGATR